MKICLVANPRSILIKRWAEFYLSQDHDVHIIYLEHIKSISNKPSIPGCKIHRIFVLTFLLLDFQFVFNYIQLLRLLNNIKPDLLHVHYLSYNAWLTSLTGYKPLVVSAWGGDIYIEAKNSKKNRKWVEVALKKADFITTTSQTLKKLLLDDYQVGPKKITSFYWGQDLNTFKKGYNKEVNKLRNKLNLENDAFVVLSSRNMDEFHGIRYIVECIPHVINKGKNVKFIFLRGSGSINFENQIKKRVKELKIEKYVIFVPEFLSLKEMAVYNNLADVVVSLPISDQFSGAVKEAMACGAIPIIRDLEVYREKIENGKNGFLVDRERPKEVAKRIIYCIDNHPEVKEKFAKINRKLLEEISDWNKNAKKMLNIYDKILQR